ncbi:MAG: Gfo/Idh/MocA family oxidoreductase [Tepidisphaeraceae bacterium]
MINTAIIAYGYAGRSLHAPLIALESRLRLSAVVARSAEKRDLAKQELNCTTYASVDECLRDQSIDLVVVTTPHDSHASIAIEALNAGKHVVVDKPMCMSLLECDAMIEAARRANRLLTVFHNRRFDGDAFTFNTLLNDGALGELKWLELGWNRFGLSKKSAWRNDVTLGGRVIDLGVHLFDRAIQFMGNDTVARVQTRFQHDWPHADVPSCATVTIELTSGRTAIIDVGSMSRYPKPQIVAVGTKATFVKFGEDPQEKALLVGNIRAATYDSMFDGKLIDESGERIISTEPGDWTRFYSNVADAIEGKAQQIVTLEQMREVMRVVDAVMRGLRETSDHRL